MSKKKTSQYLGVHWSKQKEMWRTQIAFNGKNHIIGYFAVDRERVAAMAYDKKAIELGKKTNFLKRVR